MSIDACTLRELCRDLSLLVPSRVLKIQQFQDRNILLQLKTRSGRQRLVLSLSGEASTLYLTDAPIESPERPPGFLQFLRKQLQGSELIGIRQLPDERIVHLSFRNYDELGDLQTLELIAELMGRHANLILCRDGLILEALKHVDSSQSRHREVMPLRRYVAPPERQGLSAQEILETKNLEAAELEAFSQAKNLEHFLLASLAGSSPLLATEALFRLGLDPDSRPVSLDAKGREQLTAAVYLLAELYLKTPKGAYIYYLDEAKTQGFCCHVQDLKQLPYRQHFETVSEASTQFYSAQYLRGILTEKRQSLQKALRREQKKWLRKLELHEADMASGQDYETVRRYVELLQANYPLLKKQPSGSESIAVIDYWQEEMPEIIIPLNPKQSPEKAPDSYAKMARRKEEKLRRAAELLEIDRAQLNFLAELEASLENIESEVDMLAWQQDLAYVRQTRRGEEADEESVSNVPGQKQPDLVGRKRSSKKVKVKAQPKKRKEKPLPPRRFQYMGYRIEVGRNNLQNEHLSLQKAPKGAQWFHLKGAPGAHVIVYCEASELTPELSLAAAALALWYSSLRRGHVEVSGEVDRCTVRQLRKAKGMPPGQLLYQSEGSYRLRTRGPETVEGLEILDDLSRE